MENVKLVTMVFPVVATIDVLRIVNYWYQKMLPRTAYLIAVEVETFSFILKCLESNSANV